MTGNYPPSHPTPFMHPTSSHPPPPEGLQSPKLIQSLPSTLSPDGQPRAPLGGTHGLCMSPDLLQAVPQCSALQCLLQALAPKLGALGTGQGGGGPYSFCLGPEQPWDPSTPGTLTSPTSKPSFIGNAWPLDALESDSSAFHRPRAQQM